MAKVCSGTDQITVKKPGKDAIAQCLKCLKCSKGNGASVQCYSVITPDTPLMCQPCFLGKTFSAEYGTGICEHCNDCADQNRVTVKKCTLISNSECGGCIHGFYVDGLTSQCQRCSACCGDGGDIKERECVDQSMPANQVCNVARVCKKTPTPPLPADKATTPSPGKKISGTKTSMPKVAPTPNASAFTQHVAPTSHLLPRPTIASTPTSGVGNGSVFMHDLAVTTYQPSLATSSVAVSLSTTMYMAIPVVIVLLILAIVVYHLKRKRQPSCRRCNRASVPTMEEGPAESMSLVGIAPTTDEGKEDEERLPTQNTEDPGILFQDRPLVEMMKDPSWDFHVKVNQIIVKAGGLNAALDRFETKVGEVGINSRAHVVVNVFIDAVIKKYPLMSGKDFFEVVIGEASLAPDAKLSLETEV